MGKLGKHKKNVTDGAGSAGVDTRRDSAIQKQNITAKVWELAEPLCNSEGMELIHVEYQREAGGRILRLYIDKPGGITLDDCTNVSRQLSDILDIKLDTGYPYTLEVSSPGSERPLSKLDDFKKFTGKTARIKTAYPIDGQKNFKGILLGILDDNIVLQTEIETIVIPYQDIAKARLVNFNGDDTC